MKSILFITYLYLFALVANYANGQSLTGQPISASELVKMTKTAEISIVDFRGEAARDLDGFIEGSIYIPDEMTNDVESEIR